MEEILAEEGKWRAAFQVREKFRPKTNSRLEATV